MAWQILNTIEGRCYIPDRADRPAKYHCKECFVCQQCAGERCRICRANCDSIGDRTLSDTANQEEEPHAKI